MEAVLREVVKDCDGEDIRKAFKNFNETVCILLYILGSIDIG